LTLQDLLIPLADDAFISRSFSSVHGCAEKLIAESRFEAYRSLRFHHPPRLVTDMPQRYVFHGLA
jgi:hypothetical protein